MKKKYDIIFLSIGKNVANYINFYFNFLNKLKKKKSFLSIIGENDSKDQTLEIIKTEIKKSKYDLILLNLFFLKKIRDRVLRISRGRQHLFNFIKKKSFSSKFVVVIDIDDVLPEKINVNKFVQLLEKLDNSRKELFGISIKSIPNYYDLYPLIIENYYKYPASKFSALNSDPLSYYLLRKKKIINFQKKITLMNDIKTISSHNGMTIYLFKDYIKGNYLINIKRKISEHSLFNQKLHLMTKKHILMTNDIKFKAPKAHILDSFFLVLLSYIKRFFNL